MYVQDEIMVEKFPRWSWNKLITEKRTRQTDNSRENIEIIVDDNQKKKKKKLSWKFGTEICTEIKKEGKKDKIWRNIRV